MIVSIIVAVSQNGVIGKNNDLIWHLPNDMNFFKEKTKGHHVIMGRKNFESIPHKFRPLPNRQNIIITRKQKYNAENTIVVNSLEDALDISKKNKEKETFIIGGGEIYKLALEKKLVNRIYLTHIYHDFDGDTFFPKLSSEWYEIFRKDCGIDKNHKYKYSFLTFEQKLITSKK